MKATAADTIYWTPLSWRTMFVEQPVALLHFCPDAIVSTPQTRESLDPMALGECRYCHKPLPVPA